MPKPVQNVVLVFVPEVGVRNQYWKGRCSAKIISKKPTRTMPKIVISTLLQGRFPVETLDRARSHWELPEFTSELVYQPPELIKWKGETKRMPASKKVHMESLQSQREGERQGMAA
ncbi:hypothetical protein HDU80_011318 [Chytriomyces hyalinus]|nr:hypothetical protein HDU80_011318 [Chytriomyces hyalinus]